jgi:hypothetical protein
MLQLSLRVLHASHQHCVFEAFDLKETAFDAVDVA